MKKQHVNEFLTVTRCHYCQISARFTKRKYIQRLQWRFLASLRWQQKWQVKYGSFDPEIGIWLFGRFPKITFHDRIRVRFFLPFGNAKCRHMQLRAIRSCLKNIDFPMSRTYVTTYIKALLLVRRKKERERILLRTEWHANVSIFLSYTIIARWRRNR